jgi:hypothetical protein
MEYAEMERQLRRMKEAGLDGWMLWVRFGYPFYSGRAMYRQTFEWPEDRVGCPVWLQFERLAEAARVFLNGQEAGLLPWPPWRLEVGRFLKAGRNILEIEVTNTQANQMYEQPRPSGLLGDVGLVVSLCDRLDADCIK